MTRPFVWSTAVAVLALVIALWLDRHAQEERRKVHDYAVIDSVLLTYWQPPTDALLERPRSFEGIARP